MNLISDYIENKVPKLYNEKNNVVYKINGIGIDTELA